MSVLVLGSWGMTRCLSLIWSQLTKKVNNVETSWALGATFDHFHNLNIH